ncbi:MAG: hypothetical protein IJ644_01180 [Oscillospiraceae bacterium]|nr:hypothetical protein [Oscillospiraceae bacterium]
MKKFKDMTELKDIIQETVSETVRDALKEKTESFRALPVTGQVQDVFKEFCGFSVDSAKLLLKALQVFGIFFTLVYAIRQLMKEIKSPL